MKTMLKIGINEANEALLIAVLIQTYFLKSKKESLMFNLTSLN